MYLNGVRGNSLYRSSLGGEERPLLEVERPNLSMCMISLCCKRKDLRGVGVGAGSLAIETGYVCFFYELASESRSASFSGTRDYPSSHMFPRIS